MFYVTDVSGNRVPAMEGGYLSFTKDITDDTTLTVEDSGKVCVLKAAAGAAVTLPDSAVTWNFRFVTGLAFGTSNWTITADDIIVQGGAIVNSTFVPAANENTINFVNTADTLGDFVDVVCDGTNIYVSGVGASAGSITFTVVT